MSETENHLDEAIRLLDTMASAANARTMFSANDVLDWVLDVRNALRLPTPDPVVPEAPEPAPVG